MTCLKHKVSNLDVVQRKKSCHGWPRLLHDTTAMAALALLSTQAEENCRKNCREHAEACTYNTLCLDSHSDKDRTLWLMFSGAVLNRLKRWELRTSGSFGIRWFPGIVRQGRYAFPVSVQKMQSFSSTKAWIEWLNAALGHIIFSRTKHAFNLQTV